MIERYKLNAVATRLGEYCHLSDEYDYAEAVAWHNGEGFTFVIDGKSTRESVALTWGQWRAMKKLVKELDKGEQA